MEELIRESHAIVSVCPITHACKAPEIVVRSVFIILEIPDFPNDNRNCSTHNLIKHQHITKYLVPSRNTLNHDKRK